MDQRTLGKWQLSMAILALIGVILEYVNQFVLTGPANVFSVEIVIISLTIFAFVTGYYNLKSAKKGKKK